MSSTHVLRFTISTVATFRDVDDEIRRRVSRYTGWKPESDSTTRAVNAADVELILARRGNQGRALDRWHARVKVPV